MNIVIDIEKKVNSEIEKGHITPEAIIAAYRNFLCNVHDNTRITDTADKSEFFSKLCKLYVTDNYSDIISLSADNQFVIPLLTDNNSSCDFSGFKYLITDTNDIDDDYYYKIWQRFLGLPWHILDTERCSIREMTLNDISALYELYDDPAITRYTEPLFPNYEDEYEYTRNYIHNVYEYFGFGTWVIEDRATKELIGRAGFNYRPGYEYPEIGYVIGTKYQHLGYATEVCKAILSYGFDELNFSSVMAFSSIENKPSLYLLNRLGFIKDNNLISPEYDIPLTGYILKK